MNGRKRHLLVDSQGLVLGVHITSAAVRDEHGGAPQSWASPSHLGSRWGLFALAALRAGCR
ncbi:MAG: hypothetical protein IPO91_06945 [Chloroflexi bacterium]|nr:hypothetical protein [Chloroflexota bacterium]